MPGNRRETRPDSDCVKAFFLSSLTAQYSDLPVRGQVNLFHMGVKIIDCFYLSSDMSHVVEST